MFWKKKIAKNQAGRLLLHHSWGLHAEKQSTFNEILGCEHLSKDCQLRCSWETNYLLVSLTYLFIVTFLPKGQNQLYDEVCGPFIDEYRSIIQHGEPSEEELEYHMDSVKLRYDIYGDIIESAFERDENPFQVVASIYLSAIAYIKSMGNDHIDMRSFFEDNDNIKANLYFEKENPHNFILQILISDGISRFTQKFFKKHRLV